MFSLVLFSIPHCHECGPMMPTETFITHSPSVQAACSNLCSVSAEPVGGNTPEEQWWESWTPAVNSAAQTSRVEPRTSQTHWEVGHTQQWLLFANPTDQHACVYVKHRTFCSHVSHLSLLTDYCYIYMYCCQYTGRLLHGSLSYFLPILCVISDVHVFHVCLHISG